MRTVRKGNIVEAATSVETYVLRLDGDTYWWLSRLDPREDIAFIIVWRPDDHPLKTRCCDR